MRVRAFVLVLIALSLSPILAARQQQKTALVTAVAEAGGRLADLKPADFIVKEDGSARDVVRADLANDPLVIALLIDTTQPPAGARPPTNVLAPTQDLRRGLTTFVRTITATAADAQFMMMEFAGAPATLFEFTDSATTIDRSIQRLFPNRQADAVLIDAMVEASKKMSDRPTPRRAIVTIDFGWRDSSDQKSMRDAAETIHGAGVTVWTVSVRQTRSSSSRREEVLDFVTRASGGMRFTVVESTGLESMLKSVANSLLSQYTVTFTRPGAESVKQTDMQTRRGGKVLVTPWMR
jgi:hypothetical protein